MLRVRPTPLNRRGVAYTLYLSWGPDMQEWLEVVDNRVGALSLRIGVTCDNKEWDRPQ